MGETWGCLFVFFVLFVIQNNNLKAFINKLFQIRTQATQITWSSYHHRHLAALSLNQFAVPQHVNHLPSSIMISIFTANDDFLGDDRKQQLPSGTAAAARPISFIKCKFMNPVSCESKARRNRTHFPAEKRQMQMALHHHPSWGGRWQKIFSSRSAPRGSLLAIFRFESHQN